MAADRAVAVARSRAGLTSWLRLPSIGIAAGLVSLDEPAAAVLIGVSFALAARLPSVLSSDFPLNDGGLFVAMANDVRHARFALPAITSYNGEAIPFAYPPFAFYVLAALSAGLRADPIALLRFVPLAANLATVAAVALLARRLTSSRWTALATPIVFALVPRSYEWMIMGGGLTRSFGFLFAVLCLVQARALCDGWSWRRVLACGLLAGLALASHLELGLFVAYSLCLLFATQALRLRAAAIGAAVAAIAAGVTAPWWATVLREHGLAPFLAANLTGGWTSPSEQLESLVQLLAPPSLPLSAIGGLALLGAVVCVARGQLLLPLWLGLVFVLTPRSGPSEGTLPLALLAAVGLAEAAAPGVALAARSVEPGRIARVWGQAAYWLRSRPAASAAATTACLALALATVYATWPSVRVDRHSLESLSSAEHQDMAWVAQNTPPDAQFLVLTTGWSWEEDYSGEWFPVLAQRRSVLTVQGTEWLSNERFARTVCSFEKVRDVAAKGQGVADLETWAQGHGVPFSAIYISKADRGALNWTTFILSAMQSPNYTVALDNPAATVLVRRTPLQSTWPAEDGPTVARDCQSLAEQPAATQAAFNAAYGPDAAQAWAREHEKALPPPPTLSRTVLGMVPFGNAARSSS